jgi:hypothetical protein
MYLEWSREEKEAPQLPYASIPSGLCDAPPWGEERRGCDHGGEERECGAGERGGWVKRG